MRIALSSPLLQCIVTAVLCLSSTAFAQKANNANILSLERNEIDNTPISIVFSSASNLRPGDANSIFKNYLGIDGPDVVMTLLNSTTTKQNTTIDRYVQYYKNIKVANSSYTVMSKNNVVSFMTGNYYNIVGNMQAVPQLKEAEALTSALKTVNAEQYIWEIEGMERNLKEQTKNPAATNYPKGALVWVEDLLGGLNDRKLHLAYAFNIYAVKPLSRQMVYVDAQTGRILHINQLLESTNGTGASLYSGTVGFKTSILSGINKLRDSTRGGGINTFTLSNTTGSSVSDLTSASATWASSVALDAHWGAEKVYDYWHDVQGRNSFDNAGAAINSYVHYSVNYNNAFWDGTEMVYGDGSGIASGGFSPLASLDVCAHEIGHGVCSYTAALDYNKESGGMNEGFSDIWGAVIENYANPLESDAVAKNMWLIGEEISSGGLRSMSNPNLGGQPDTYGGSFWYTVTGCVPSSANDQCGVHTNSGVLNYWFYLLSTGGSGTNDIGNTYSVTGIGVNEAADIAYQTELLLGNTANYAVCRTASISAATVMYGACSPEVAAVTKAWYAVGVGANYTGGTAPAITGSGIVCVSMTTTLANATSGGTWSSGAPAIATIGASTGVVTGVTPGTANITYTVSGGCTATKVVTVNTATTPAITGTALVCAGLTTTLSATPAGGTWTSSTASVATIGSSSGIATGSTAGTSTISYSSTCGLTATKILTVQATPAAITGPSNMCVGTTVTYSSSTGGGVWSVSSPSVATIGTASGIATPVAAGTANIIYTAGGCSVSRPVTVSVTADAGTISNHGGEIITWAGNGSAGYDGDGGNVSSSVINGPKVMTKDASGNLYFADEYNLRVRKVTPAGVISTYAGNGSVGFSGDGGPATAATFNNIYGLAVDASGNLYIADNANGRVRKVNTSGIITTIAGAGFSTYNGDNIAATAANLYTPYGLAIDNTGNLFIAEEYRHIIRKVNLATGIITRFAGTGTSGYNGDNIAATSAQLYYPHYLSTDEANNLYITDNSNHRIRKVNNAGIITTVAGNGLAGYSGDGVAATSTKIHFSGGTRMDGAGNLYITDALNSRIRKVNSSGIISTIAGTGASSYTGDNGPATAATFIEPHDMELDDNGDILVLDHNANVIRKIYNHPPIVAGVITLCPGVQNTLTSTVSGGAWSSSNPAIATVGSSSGIVTAIASGSAVVSYSITNGCGTAVAVVTVNVNPLANAGAISGASSVSVGGTITLTESVSGGTWSAGNANATVSSAGIVTGVASGTVTISYSVSNSCGMVSATKVITVGDLTASVSGAHTVCAGSMATLTGSPSGGSWTSSNTAVATVGTGGVVAGIISGTSTISYTVGTSVATHIVTVGQCCCLTDSLVINTGYNPATGSVITPGTPGSPSYDSRWRVTGLSTLCQAYNPSLVPPYSAFVVPSVDWTATSSVSRGISIGNGQNYPTTSTGDYSAMFSRPFTLCDSDCVSFNLNLGFDWIILGVYIDGNLATSYYSSAPYYCGFCSYTAVSFTKCLSAGTHTLDIKLGNDNMATTGNGFGLNIKGSITSTTGHTPIIRESAACASYSCSAPFPIISGPASVCTGATITCTSNVTTGTWSSGNTAVATVGSGTGVVAGVAAGTAIISFTNTYGCVATHTVTVGSCCLTDSLVINTGYNPATGTVIAPGTPGSPAYDPRWKITQLSSLCQAYNPSLVPPYSAFVVPSVDWTATSSVSRGISIGNSQGYPTASTGSYTAMLSRPFTLCDSDCVSFNLNLGFDWIILGVYIDGNLATSYYSSAPYYCGFCSYTAVSFTKCLSAGTHTLDIKLGNDNVATSVNGFGLNVKGSITSTTGHSPLVSESAACASYACGGTSSPVITGPSSVCTGTTITCTSNVTTGTWSSSNTAVATVGATTGIVAGVGAGTAIISFTASSGVATHTVTVSSCCLTDSLVINTGYNPATGTVITPGTAGSPSYDSRWKVTGLSTLCQAYNPSLIPPYSAFVVPSVDWTATSSVSRGISIGNGQNYPTTSTGDYSAMFSRPFTLCDSDCVSFNLNLGFDWIILGVYIDGNLATSYYSSAPYYCGFCSYTAVSFTKCLSAGTHTLDIKLGNDNLATTGNGFGLNIKGSITSTTGHTPIVSESAACASYSCGSSPVITGVANVCVGGSATLTGTPAGGTWSSSNPSVASITSGTGIVTGIADGTAIISYTTPSGYMDTKIITVNAAPSAGTITGPSSVTVGSTITLTDAVAGGTWSASNTNATVSSAGIVTGAVPGTVTVSYAVSNSCGTAYATKIITVNAATGPITGTLAVCAGSTTTLGNSVTGGSWYSSTTAVATITSAGVVSGISAGTSTISYVVSGSTVTAVVTVYAVPPPITGSVSVCIGSTTTLSNAVTGGTWTSASAAIATVDAATGVVTGITAGTTLITYTTAGGCYRTWSMTVKPLPATITGAATLCVGSSTTYTDATSGGLSWSSSNPSVAAIGAASGVLTAASIGTTTITFTLISGCIATKTVSVIALPAPISGSSTVCAGSTTALTDADPDGTWSSTSTTIATVGSSTGIVSGVAAGVTAIIYSTGAGCNRTMYMTVNPLPAVITGATTLCAGTTTALTDVTTGGTWTSGTPSVATISSSGLVTGISSGVSVITYTLGTGCMRTTTVTVSGALTGTTGNPVTCVGQTTTLSNSTAGGTWASSSAVVATVTSAGVVTGVSMGTANITYTISSGCRAVTTVTVNASMPAITGPGTVCVNASITLANAVAGGTWSSSSTALGTIGATSGVMTGIAAGTPTITYMLSSGCLRTIAVVVKPLPAAITGVAGLCVSATSTLTDATSGISWASSTPSVATIGAASGLVTGISAGTSTITFTATNSCIATRIVTVDAAPPIAAITGPSTVVPGLSITLADATPGGVWSSSNTAVLTVTSGGVVTGVSGPAATISYTVTTGVCAKFATKLITVSKNRPGFALTGDETKFSVYPNPTTGAFTLYSSVAGVFSVYTMDGKQVQQTAVTEGSNSLSLPKGIAAGVYLCRFNGDDGSSEMVRLIYE